ncbi:MAG TPA: glycoside hydrolase family 99-like domain-containing protein [Galbitalea sp.]
MRPKVFAYYFPDYHVDPRNEAWFGDGWTEWNLVRDAQPRFDGQLQPRIPLLGYEDESDPEVAAEYIQLAASHGIDGFLFDYYWYDDGPYLEGALEKGFLKAPNTGDMEFSLMWANHELVYMFPLRDATSDRTVLKHGGIDRAAFERFGEYVIANYFSRPNYTRIDGRPRFTIYDVGQFVTGLGGIDEAVDALTWFRNRAKEEGHGGVYLDIIIWGFAVLPTDFPIREPGRLLRVLGADSASSYVWVHHAALGPASAEQPSWTSVGESAFAAYEEYATTLPVPFHPNVTTGWDATPRLGQEIEYPGSTYPGGPAFPPSVDEFRDGLLAARAFVERHPLPHQEVTINAWNEWTEGSYLLPDTVNGYGFLEAVLEVFGPREPKDAQ